MDVIDTGTGTAAAAAEGSGILGMRARAQALGGLLDARPRAQGGFAVRARLPREGAPE